MIHAQFVLKKKLGYSQFNFVCVCHSACNMQGPGGPFISLGSSNILIVWCTLAKGIHWNLWCFVLPITNNNTHLWWSFHALWQFALAGVIVLTWPFIKTNSTMILNNGQEIMKTSPQNPHPGPVFFRCFCPKSIFLCVRIFLIFVFHGIILVLLRYRNGNGGAFFQNMKKRDVFLCFEINTFYFVFDFAMCFGQCFDLDLIRFNFCFRDLFCFGASFCLFFVFFGYLFACLVVVLLELCDHWCLIVLVLTLGVYVLIHELDIGWKTNDIKWISTNYVLFMVCVFQFYDLKTEIRTYENVSEHSIIRGYRAFFHDSRTCSWECFFSRFMRVPKKKKSINVMTMTRYTEKTHTHTCTHFVVVKRECAKIGVHGTW